MEKKIVEFTIESFRRIFAYAPNFTDIGLEIIQLGSGSKAGNLLFEQYTEENEDYPRITVAGVGGVYNQIAFNDLISVYDNDYYQMGSRNLQQLYIGGDTSIVVPVPVDLIGQSIRGVFTTVRWTGIDFGNYDLGVYLYQNYNTNPVLLSSGSISSNYIPEHFKEMYASLSEETLITDDTFCLVYQVPAGASYYIGIDTSFNGTYYYNGISQSGSVVSRLLLPGFVRVGGFFDGSLQFKCEAKNDTNMPRNLIEIIAQYFTLLKHAQVMRNNQDTLMPTDGLAGSVSEWLSKGIMIKAIREGPLSVRPRSTNDKIFGVTLTVDYYTEWFEDFPYPSLLSIEVLVNTFLENITNNLAYAQSVTL